jgi:hypothetical protein
MNDPVFKLSRAIRTPVVNHEELIVDLRRVAELLGTKKIRKRQYESHGKYSTGTIQNRFGTWNKALIDAGLKTYNAKADRARISELKLFENILTLWQHYGRQPRISELALAPSSISTQAPYRRRFGSWMNALEAFVEYANGTDTEVTKGTIEEATETQITNVTENVIVENIERSKNKPIVSKRGPRQPGRMLIMQVLIRDQGICQLCKRAATADNLNYHIDHIFPWIKGGPTILSNLQLLCSRCNLIKGDLDLTTCIESST